MAAHQRKSSHREGRSGGRRFTPGNAIGDRRPPTQAPGEDEILAALGSHLGGATAGELAERLPGADPRELGVRLRRLVEQGRVCELRPGRYQASGEAGEHSALLEAAGEGLAARLEGGDVRPVHPRHRLGSRAGDVVQVLIGDDGFALVTRVLRRNGREVVGTVLFQPGGPVLICDNRREGRLPIRTLFEGFDREYQAGARVLGTLKVGEDGQAWVELTRMLPPESPEQADFRYVSTAHDLPGEFPPEVEAQARSQATEFPLGRREDLTQKLVFTIDPTTAKDFDDAISIERDRLGRWVLGVHIADVSHFVPEGGPLDQEACLRGTSVYLINRVIPMLPEALSNGLCSLVPGQPRYCLSAFLTLDRQCRLVETRLAETLIRSRHRLDYGQALEVLEDRDQGDWCPSELRSALKQVGSIAQTLRKAREKAGALNLYSVEHGFNLDVEGSPIEVTRSEHDQAHQLIEECMLLANRAVAAWVHQAGLPCVYRVHEAPDEERLEQFGAVLEAYGKDSAGVTERFGLQRLLEALKREPPAARIVLNHLLLRCFKKAVYQVENQGHYALAFAHYAHFTSPIRRYPDLLVHRLVKRGLGLDGYAEAEARPGYLDALAKQASWLEQRAALAERDLDARKAARYLANRLGEELPGVVVTATGGGAIVQLLETGMEGLLPLRELKDDYYTFDPARLSLVGRRSGRLVGPGTELDVIVTQVEIERADVIFSLARAPLAATHEVEDPRRRVRGDQARQRRKDRRRR